MRNHLAYLRYVLRHKYYVVVASRLTGVPLLQALLHDLSKFTLAEWGPYARSFFNPDGTRRHGKGTPEFDLAWLHHQKRNLHHPQAWALVRDHGSVVPQPMPLRYVKEMVADWLGAGAAKSGRGIDIADTVNWYLGHGPRVLHPETRAAVETILNQLCKEKKL